MKNLRRLLSLVLALTMLLAINTISFAAADDTGYHDVAVTDWYAEAVQYVRDNGLMSGTSDGVFSPEADTSRGMLATILYRAAGSPSAIRHSFTDIPFGIWYETAAAWANSYGIMSGYGNGLFGGDDPVTREQLVTIFWRYAGAPEPGSSTDFADEASISVYAAQAADWARANHIINGKDGNIFDPKGTATRAEAATILRNYMAVNPRTPQRPAGSQQPVTPQQPPQEAETPSTTPTETPQRPSTSDQTTANPSRPSSTSRPSSSNRPSYDRPSRPTPPVPEPTPTPTPTPTSNILVAYFSATNNTKTVAGYIADTLDADQYEIIPTVPYTSDDLDWTDPNSRVNTEHNNPNSRPAIRGSRDLSAYDTVFLGYPIWWGEAPNIIRTFMENHNLDSKTVIPFCTSSSSGLGSSADNLHLYAPNANWRDGQRFHSGASRTEVQQWILSLNLGGNTPDPTPEPDPTPTPDPTPEPDPTPMPDPTPEPDPTPTPDPIPGTGPSVLVAYFSGTGTTRGVAQNIASALGADTAVLHEIVPQQPYTAADLDYTNSNCRSVQEQRNPAARPSISGSVENMDNYDIVFLGYPIWNNDAPRIIYTFLEKESLSGKTIVPFCTSGGSSIQNSVSNIRGLVNDAVWMTGRRCYSSDTISTLTNWVNGLGLDLTPTPTPAPDPAPSDKTQVLVAYFSATNTTKPLAEYIADGLEADIYEIVPETPYTSADLNYGNSSSRTSVEMNDPHARPVISGNVDNMEQYDVIFIGYPIWWGQAPRIISTFLESYNFSGKTIVPFCTSGSSGIGSSATNLQGLTSGAVWLDGRRFGGGTSSSTMMEWVNSLGLDITRN